MNRPVLAPEKVSQSALTFISGYHQDVVTEVANAVANNKVVVVGMSQNPFVGKARKALQNAAVEFKYLQYGSYFSHWKPRLAIKLWSGWRPTHKFLLMVNSLVALRNLTKKLSLAKLRSKTDSLVIALPKSTK